MFGSHDVRKFGKRQVRAFRPLLAGLEHRLVLSTFRVNTTLDTVAVNLKNGQDTTGHISLRSAIMAADAKPNADTIIVPAGTFALTIGGTGEDNDATGDLDITGNLTLKGKGAGTTIIDGNDIDRVIQVLSGKVAISGVTIQHGFSSVGAGILNTGGRVILTSVTVQNNEAISFAGINGAIGANGTALGSDGRVGTSGSTGEGGGIFNAAGSFSISKSLIISNQVFGGTGGTGGKSFAPKARQFA